MKIIFELARLSLVRSSEIDRTSGEVEAFTVSSSASALIVLSLLRFPDNVTDANHAGSDNPGIDAAQA